jgi:hypothetical protein
MEQAKPHDIQPLQLAPFKSWGARSLVLGFLIIVIAWGFIWTWRPPARITNEFTSPTGSFQVIAVRITRGKNHVLYYPSTWRFFKSKAEQWIQQIVKRPIPFFRPELVLDLHVTNTVNSTICWVVWTSPDRPPQFQARLIDQKGKDAALEFAFEGAYYNSQVLMPQTRPRPGMPILKTPLRPLVVNSGGPGLAAPATGQTNPGGGICPYWIKPKNGDLSDYELRFETSFGNSTIKFR